MKAAYLMLLTFCAIPSTWGANPISVEEFKKIPLPGERHKIIEQAPPEQKEELKKIDLHLFLLTRWDGEAGLKRAKETYIAEARGLGTLEEVFKGQKKMWEGYLSDKTSENAKAGMALENQARAEKERRDSLADVTKRLEIVHLIVFKMAASPEALELAKRAEKLCIDIGKRFDPAVTPYQPIEKKDVMAVDKECDQLFQEMKKLPGLPPEQLRKEYDAFSDQQLATFSTGAG